MLNALLEKKMNDDEIQKLLIQKLKQLLISLAKFVLAISAIVIVSIFPLYIYGARLENQVSLLANAKGLAIFIGSILPFIFAMFIFKKSDSSYTEISKLLHQIILNNFNVALKLFSLDKKLTSKTRHPNKDEFYIISGLARSGTTAFTLLLNNSEKFYSLNYANMPFLLGPNLWKKIYNPKNRELRERGHKDGINIGLNSIEALDEYFFKAILKDSFVEANSLKEHVVSRLELDEYLDYHSLIGAGEAEDKIYLSKNNNFLLRYKSIRNLNTEFKIVFMFRDPISQGKSLLNQHLEFSKMQTEDPFILEYMNWLGHHEFGLNHKRFSFNRSREVNEYPKESINYWLQIWINYYSVLVDLESSNNTVLVSYKDFLNSPKSIVSSLEEKWNIDLNIKEVIPFTNEAKPTDGIDDEILKQANTIYEKLNQLKLVLSDK